jgi:hypothetical protein
MRTAKAIIIPMPRSPQMRTKARERSRRRPSDGLLVASGGSGSEGFGFEPKRGISNGYRSIPGHNPIVSDFVGNPGHTRVKTRKAEIHRCIRIGSDRTFNPLVLGSSPSSLTGFQPLG